MQRLQVLKRAIVPRNYELLLNRTYSNSQATLAVLPEIDALLTSKGYVGNDVLDQKYGRWGLAEDMRASGHKEIDYVKSMGRRVDVDVSPKEDNNEMLQVCAKWGLVPVGKEVMVSLRNVAVGPCKKFDVSTVNQRISEAQIHSSIISTFGRSHQWG